MELDRNIEPAPAKINLYLHVGPRRADGYHKLESVIVFTGFGDEVALSPAAVPELVREGPFATGLPDNTDEDLCMRAVACLCAEFGRDANVRISLHKNIPVAAGVGGGSADAAAVLRLLCRMWGVPTDDPRVAAVARELGADVPVCLLSRAAHVRGLGEQVTPLAGFPMMHLLLVNPAVPLSTASVFRAYGGGGELFTDPPSTLAPDALRDLTRNDLEAPAASLCPEIADVLTVLEGVSGCRLARMSGSGPTCFGVFDGAYACATAARHIVQARPGWWVCPTRTVTD